MNLLNKNPFFSRDKVIFSSFSKTKLQAVIWGVAKGQQNFLNTIFFRKI
jgi:hypothetical protein